jgi:hypothetical protein
MIRTENTHGQTAHVNTNNEITEIVARTRAQRQKHMQHTNTVCNTEEIVGSGRFRGCWLVPQNRKRGAIICTVTESGTKRAAAAFAIAARIRTRMRETVEHTCAPKRVRRRIGGVLG